MNIIQSSIDNIKRCTIFAYEKFITEDIAKSINVRNFKPRFNERNQLVEDLEFDFEESLKILNYVLKNNKLIKDMHFNYRNFGMLDFIEAINECYCLSMGKPSEGRILSNLAKVLQYISTKELCEKFDIPNIHEKYEEGELYYGVLFSTKNVLNFLDFMLKNEGNFNFETEYGNIKEYLTFKDVYNDFKKIVKDDKIMIRAVVDEAPMTELDFQVFNEAWMIFAKKEKLKNFHLPLPTKKLIGNLYDNVFDIEIMLEIVKIANEDNNIEKCKILEDRLEILKNKTFEENALSFIIGYLDRETCNKFNLPYFYDEIDSGKTDYGINYNCNDLLSAFKYVIEKLKNNPEYKAEHTHEEANKEEFKRIDVEQVYHDLKEDFRMGRRSLFNIRRQYSRKHLKKYDYVVLINALRYVGKSTAKQFDIPCYWDNNWNINIEEEIAQEKSYLIKSMRDMGYTLETFLCAISYLLETYFCEKYLDRNSKSLYEQWEVLIKKLEETLYYILYKRDYSEN